MQLVPESDRNLEQATQRRVNEHAKLQRDYGKNLERVDVSGYGLHNWFDSKKEITLLQKLMSLDSITEKVIGMGKDQRKFYGRLFYAIVYSKDTRSASFYFLPSNRDEARSVAIGLALFIRDEFGLDPCFYCKSDTYYEATRGHWEHKKRRFLTKFEKEDADRMEQMRETLAARPVEAEFISMDHARALATENDSIKDDQTAVMKGSKEPRKLSPQQQPGIDTIDLTSKDGCESSVTGGTGSTNSSKAQRYASEAVLKAQREFLKGQLAMQETLTEKNTQLMEQQAAIKHLTELVQSMTGKTVAIPTENSDSNTQDVLALDDTSDQSSQSEHNNDTNNLNARGNAKSMDDHSSLEDTTGPKPRNQSTPDDDVFSNHESSDDDSSMDDPAGHAPHDEFRLEGAVFNTNVASPARIRKGENTRKDYGLRSAHSDTLGQNSKSRRISSNHDPTKIPLPPEKDDEHEDVSMNRGTENPHSGPVGGMIL